MSEILNIIKKYFLDNPISKTDFEQVYECNDEGNILLDTYTIKTLQGKFTNFSITNFNTLLLLEYYEEKKEANFQSFSFFTKKGLYTFRRKYIIENDDIYYFTDDDLVAFKEWKDIKNIELFEIDGYLRLRFYFYSTDNTNTIILKRFGTIKEKGIELIKILLDEIVSFIKKLSKKIENCNDDKIGLKLLEDYSESYSFDSFYKKNKARFLMESSPNEALDIINNCLNEYEDNDTLADFNELKSEILFGSKLKGFSNNGQSYFDALNYKAISIDYRSENITKNEHEKLKKEILTDYSNHKNHFFEITKNKREVIFVSDYIYPIRADNLKIILKNDQPKDIIFPINHPQLNEIYTFHPFNDKSYLPIKEYETTLFVDKVNELQQLLQCLGATRVEILSSKNNIEKRTTNTKSMIFVEGGYNGVEINGGYEKEEGNSNFNKESLNIEGVQVFKPTKSPFLPENLNWYHSEISWQKLVNQRMSGNLLHHKFIIQSSQKSSISKSEAKKINAEIKVIFAKGGFEYSNEESIETTKKENIEFIVDVTFEDKELLKEEHKKKLSFLTDGTDEYENEVKFMLEDDGKIDKNERSILNRKMKKLNISIEQAKEIETKVLNSNYSIEELKYIEEIKDFIKEGDITDTVKNMLDRYAKKFSISKKSQKEINLKFNIK